MKAAFQAKTTVKELGNENLIIMLIFFPPDRFAWQVKGRTDHKIEQVAPDVPERLGGG